ncbi:hypothetical protein K490DRAFT_76389 [Saccharata proteae CBS 121410]|uniref:AD domain-containing protein n=1 Tax=Saccharata proteae CBS 121410 TaxID=1314787 RepID=A0A9P4LTE6_9PEZI|nr:hypothetical protein K490DRAFT_76389 [Saccharata proteae CBS 121410]
MADGKRLSNAGKIATPKLGDQSILNDSFLFKAIGKRIRVTTTLNTILEGTLFTADPVMNILAINAAPAPPNPSTSLAGQPGNYHIIPIPQIQDFKLLSSAEDDWSDALSAENAVPHIGPLDHEALKAREEQTIRKMKEKDATRGKGVPKEAQEVFDWINRTLPTRWHDKSIIVNDAIILGPPYTVNDLKAAEGKEAQLPQIKKVMEAWAKKKGAAAGKPGVATPIPPRKGG